MLHNANHSITEMTVTERKNY